MTAEQLAREHHATTGHRFLWASALSAQCNGCPALILVTPTTANQGGRMKIRITMIITDEDLVDEDHPMGVTTEGYEAIVRALLAFGEDIDIEQA